MATKKKKIEVGKWFQFSKLITIFSGVLFACALYYALTCNRADVDTAIVSTVIGASGSVFLTCLVWYLKKSCQENTAYIRITHAEKIAELEYKYWLKKAKDMKTLNLTESDLYKINESSSMDEMMTNAINQDINYLDNTFENHSSDPEVQYLNTNF